MTVASKYNPSVAWRTLASQVFQLTRETVNNPATYRMTVKAIDTNNPGAGQKEIGYYAVDFWGIPFSIIGTGSTYVDVQDDFRVGRCPTSGKMAVIYKSVFNGRALYLGQIDFQFLHPLAYSNYQKYADALIWANDPNAKKIPFADAVRPAIENYQSDQVDPEDPTKTINYAEDFGEKINIKLFIVVDANTSFECRKVDPIFTYIDGLIDTISFDYGDPNVSCYLIISK